MIVGSILTATKGKSKTDFAFGGFIAILPFGFAARKEFLYLIIFLSVILITSFLLLRERFKR